MSNMADEIDLYGEIEKLRAELAASNTTIEIL